MIEELYDSVLSITNQTGYLDRIYHKESRSHLRWSSNNKFNLPLTWSYTKPPYNVIAFSHDDFFRTPFSSVINERGEIDNVII